MERFRILSDAIEPRMLDGLVRSEHGGTVTFFGIVRSDSDDGRPVTALRYEAFEPMALREFEAIAGEARERFGDAQVGIVHRVGEVRAGEISVVVLAAAAHRAEAFAACRYAIDEIKRRAPIWKQECYADGGAEWRSSA